MTRSFFVFSDCTYTILHAIKSELRGAGDVGSIKQKMNLLYQKYFRLLMVPAIGAWPRRFFAVAPKAWDGIRRKIEPVQGDQL
jgi:hypothetical protein